MATKTEMVTFILDNSEEYTQAYLDSLSYKKIKTIFGETETSPENVDHPDLIPGDENSDDELIDVDELVNVDKFNEYILDESQPEGVSLFDKEEEEEVWNYENLSPNDQRLYRRTGIKRISKSNKYNRFDEEKPKI